MRLASKGGVGFWEAQAFRLFRMRKRARQFVKYRPGCDKTVLFIVGCQRSGTSMLHHLFRLDPDTVTYDEVSPLSDARDPRKLRWIEPSRAAKIIRRQRAPLVVTKPLVEAQVLDRWREALPETRTIWMFRGYRDVVRSNLAFFGPDNGWNDLQPILEGDDRDWRFQNLAPEVIETIRDLVRNPLRPSDAAALFWYARNSLLFTTGMHEDPHLAVCRYEDLVRVPAEVLRAIYQFLGRPFPGSGILKDIRGNYIGRGESLEFTPAVEVICDRMQARLLARPRLRPPVPQ